MTLSLGFSPCPNDAFIFYALVNRKIDLHGSEFISVIEDVETLNRWALEGKLDITKLSFGVLPLVLNEYVLLNSGSALGKGVGPLLIINKELEIRNAKVEAHTIAIPGEHTTANLLFSLAYPDAVQKQFMSYDQIEAFVLAGKGLGVIIHENRFTYEQKGLHKIIDLGDYWENRTGMSIPLGGIVIKRSFPDALSSQVESLIKKSIAYAGEKYPELNDYIRSHSQEMEEDVMRKHIELYVNAHSLNLGEDGRQAVLQLLNIYQIQHNNKTFASEDIFLAANQSR